MEYKYKVLTVTTIGVFMTYLDSSVIVVGLPTVVEDLKASLFLGIWAISGYALTITVLLVAIGHMADIVGRVKLYNSGFAIFTVGSALCALSANVETLITFRIIQALGGALVVANTLAIITDSFPASELGKALGIQAMSISAGTMTGYVLSGVMIGLFGWRSIFWLNVPVGTFGVFWCHKRLKEHYVKLSQRSYDYQGAIIFSTAITLLLIAMTKDLREPLVKLLTGLSGVLFVGFLVHEKRASHPVIDMALFRIRSFAVGNFGMLLNGLAISGLAFLLTLYLQLVRGFGVLIAGIALLPLDFAMILISPISGSLSDKYGSRGLTTAGLGTVCLSLFLLANLTTDSSSVYIVTALALAGAGAGLFRSPNATSVMKSAPPELRGIANGVRATMFNTSIAMAIPLAMAVMSTILPYDKLAAIVNTSLLTNREEMPALLSALGHAFYALAFISALGAIISALGESP